MTVSTRHSLYAVNVAPDALGASPVILGGITAFKLQTLSEVISDTTSGQVYPTHQAISAQKPAATFTTKSIAAGLSVCGLTGLPVFALTRTGVVFYCQKHQEGGGRASGSAHRTFTIKEGLLIPKRLTCQHGKDAELEYELLMSSDGTNDPFVLATGAALSGSVTDAERFTIGAVTLESVAFPQITDFSLDFGIKADALGADSDKWPTHISIEDAHPELTLNGIDASWFGSSKIPLAGLAATHANTKLYLRKRSRTSSSSFVADATPEHIKFTTDGLAVIDDVFDASEQAAGKTSLRVKSRYDGSNAPLVINTASAIT